MYNYKQFIEDNFQIVNKESELVDFKLNAIQNQYLMHDATYSDLILKARQQGFSSLITAIFSTDFILKEYSYSVIAADIEDNAEGLLEKVKLYIQSYEEKNKIKVPLKYNSRAELSNPLMNSRFKIATSKNIDFGRSKTFTNLHCSEVAFFSNIQRVIAGAGQSVVETGKKIFETTANGFNELKTLWDDSKQGKTNLTPLFYKASDFYSKEFLDNKRRELGRLFAQEYPETDLEAFLTSGLCYFDSDRLQQYLRRTKEPMKQDLMYVTTI